MRYMPAILLFVAGAAVSAAFLQWDQVKSAASYLVEHGNTASIVLAAFTGAIVAVWGVMSQRAITRRQVTLQYISAIESDESAVLARQKFNELVKSPGGLAIYASDSKLSSEEARSIQKVLNQYELISIGIQRGIIDYELYRLWFRSGTIMAWNYAEPFVRAIRNSAGNDMIYHEFESMAGWFKGSQKPPKRGYILGQLLK